MEGEGKRGGVYTDLAIEGAGVGDVFLGLVGIHWVALVGFSGWREDGKYTSEPLGDLCDSTTVSKVRWVNEMRRAPLGSKGPLSI